MKNIFKVLLLVTFALVAEARPTQYIPVYPVYPVYPVIPIVPYYPVQPEKRPTQLFVKNDCKYTINVMIWTWEPSIQDYTTTGTSRLYPGEKSVVATTTYDNAYIYAESDSFYDYNTQQYRTIKWEPSTYYRMWYRQQSYKADRFSNYNLASYASVSQTYSCNNW